MKMRNSTRWNGIWFVIVLVALCALAPVNVLHAAPKPTPAQPAPVSASLTASPDPTPQSAGGHSVTLSWTASSDAAANTALNYSVYRATPSCTSTFTKVNQNVTIAAYTDSSVGPGSYCYYVTSVLNGAESVPSNKASAVILPAAPAQVTVTGTN